MGTKLVKIYDEAKALGGLSAQVKLAMITKMAQGKAADAEDSPENIARFKSALAEITAGDN